MLLGAAAALHTLTKDEHYPKVGGSVLDAVVVHLTSNNSSAEPSDTPDPSGVVDDTKVAGGVGAAKTVLCEPPSISLTVHSRQCDASHDPSASAGGDLFSFKGVFMQRKPVHRIRVCRTLVSQASFARAVLCAELPGFLAAAKEVLTPMQLAAARKLVVDSSNSAWWSRVVPPFPDSDICNEALDHPPSAGSPPKYVI